MNTRAPLVCGFRDGQRGWFPNDWSQRPEVRISDGRLKIGGHAAVYYSSSDPGTEYYLREKLIERIAPGAFDRTVADTREDVVALFNHSPNLLLGRRSAGTLRIWTDGKGLGYEIDTAETSIARDVLVMLGRGDLRGSSFSFNVRSGGERYEKSDGVSIRTLTDLHLVDVSPCTFPAYLSTDASLRDADHWRTRTQAVPDLPPSMWQRCDGLSWGRW